MGDDSQNTARQLRDLQEQMSSNRDRLAAGTAEIQRLLQVGDMGKVAAMSSDLEATTRTVRDLEMAAAPLIAGAGGGVAIDFAPAEQAIARLSASSGGGGGGGGGGGVT